MKVILVWNSLPCVQVRGSIMIAHRCRVMENCLKLWWKSTLSCLLLVLSLSLCMVSASDLNAVAIFFRSVNLGISGCSLSAMPGCPSSSCGVFCDGTGNVEAIYLSGRGLEGIIPINSLGALKMLKYLNLSKNKLSGTLPADLGNLHQLQHMDLSDNHFSGLIPQAFLGLQSLITLSLAGNHLNGSIPTSLGALQHLTSLNLSSNLLDNFIPMELSSLTNLTLLDLHSNQLSGPIDSAFLALSYLMSVDLSDNKFLGLIPWQPNDTLLLFNNVVYVNLSHNQFTGPLVPEKFSSMFAQSLRVLDMSFNQLAGVLPDFEFVMALEVLQLSNNLFTGTLPQTLFSAPALQELDLSSNNLTGEIPRILSTTLRVLNLSSNLLSGTIPENIGSCAVIDLGHNQLQGNLSLLQYWTEMLEVLDLGFNNLSGKLVDFESKFMRLSTLGLSHNTLYGTIPWSYGLFPRLISIDLGYNQLNGSIPYSFFNSSTLSSLFLSNNALGGNLPIQSAISVLNYSPSSESRLRSAQVLPMKNLHLSNNKLDGVIPTGLTNYLMLEELDLSGNQISGGVSSVLCNLTMLRVLDLSDNLLTGSIPEGLPNSLLVLHLAYNNLSGHIPEDLKRFPNSSFFPGNEGLLFSWLTSPNSLGSSTSSLSQHKRHIGAAVKAGIIGGILGCIVLFLIVGLFLYCHISLTQNGDKGKSQRIWNPCAAYFAFHDYPDSGPAGTSFSSDSLLQRLGISSFTSLHKGTLVSCSWGSDADFVGSAPTRGMEMSSSQTRQFESSRLQEESALGSSVVLKVWSPDKLAGDLQFLDKSLKFSVEELSRAPAVLLGRSSHGTSYKATLDNGHVITVKWLREGLAKSKKEIAREAKKFAKVRHPNLIPLRGYYWGPCEHEKLILSDFVSMGSLAAHLVDRTGQGYAPLSWKQRLEIVVDIARGLLYLHEERNLPHGNLKATNVLLDGPNLNGQLADYSLHQLMTSEGTTNQILNAGALGYRAPELATINKPRPSLKGDVYAFGVIMLEVLTGKGAGDIISGQSGAVDLTDWVRFVVAEVRTIECFDPLLVGIERDREPPKGMHDMLAVALKCISPQPLDRPHIRPVYEELMSISL